ncbi:MAG: cation:proton antiporter [Syntrophothermus sp.]
MEKKDLFSIPVTDPVLIFAIILAIILILPLLLRMIRIPGMIGMILAGIILGPKGLNILNRDSSIELFGAVGVIYIMFLAGLEIDFEDFLRNKHKSLIFGSFTFIIPLSLGFLGAHFILALGTASAILLSSMFSSHTLLAYPIASKLGLSKSEPVTVTVGSTVITDILALLILAVIIETKHGELTILFWIKLLVSLFILSGAIFLGIPRLTIWFFRNFGDEGTRQFVFTLFILLISAFLAELAGVEPIIGAFLSGLAINRYIPSTSPLMNRVQFVGETIFIPFFLISVGMIVDVSVLYSGLESWVTAITMTVIAFTAKYLAAFLAQKTLRYSALERNVMFGLSSAHMAATLAVVIVGIRVGIFDNIILNGTVIMILVTSIVSTVVVENEGRKLAVLEDKKFENPDNLQERIIIPISAEKSIEQLVDIALMVRDPKSESPVYALKVVRPQERDLDVQQQIIKARRQLDKAVSYASATESEVTVISRIDVNIADGITRAVRELIITDLIIDWEGGFSTGRKKIFGRILDGLLRNISIAVYVCRIVNAVNTVTRLRIVMAEYAEYENGFPKWAEKIAQLIKQTGASAYFYGTEHTINTVRNTLEERKPPVTAEYARYEELTALTWGKNEISKDDMFILVSARPGTISSNRSLDRFPGRFVREFPDINLIVLYPGDLK